MQSRTERKDAQLRRMKGWAGALFLLMLCLYALGSVFEPRHPPLFWLTAFTEAAMVGAIADWFAVVALFHHPLGLRLPHTAVIPRNKGRIAEGVADFIESNFLSPEAIVARIAEARPARTLCGWLLQPRNADMLGGYFARMLSYVLGAVDDRRRHGDREPGQHDEHEGEQRRRPDLPLARERLVAAEPQHGDGDAARGLHGGDRLGHRPDPDREPGPRAVRDRAR